MKTDGAVREKEILADLAVRHPAGGHLGDLELLGREPIGSSRQTPKTVLARRAQFASRPFSPGDGAKGVERLACEAQRSTRLGNSTLTAKPSPVGKEHATSQKRPSTDVLTQRGFKLRLSVAVVSEKRLCISNLNLSPTRRGLTG